MSDGYYIRMKCVSHRQNHRIGLIVFEYVVNTDESYCILASCYIRFTLNICSFVHQCNTFTFYFLLFVDMFQPHHIGKNWHNRAPASGEYTITLEDGRVRPKHVDE
jgi:hypothetical protein